MQGLYNCPSCTFCKLGWPEVQGRQLHLRSCHFEVCLLQEQVDSLQSDLEALRQKDRDRVAHFKDKARKQVIECLCKR